MPISQVKTPKQKGEEKPTLKEEISCFRRAIKAAMIKSVRERDREREARFYIESDLPDIVDDAGGKGISMSDERDDKQSLWFCVVSHSPKDSGGILHTITRLISLSTCPIDFVVKLN